MNKKVEPCGLKYHHTCKPSRKRTTNNVFYEQKGRTLWLEIPSYLQTKPKTKPLFLTCENEALIWKNENKKWRERREKWERTVRWWNTKRGRENSEVPNDRERKEEMQCNKLENVIKRMQLK